MNNPVPNAIIAEVKISHTCVKCNQTFKSEYNLKHHLKRKYPCDLVLKCDKCDKIFKNNAVFTRHKNRKTSCAPIQGDPTKATPTNTCHFCYKKFSYKHTLKKHFDVCKIKNGGMAILFKTINDLKEEVKILKANQTQVITPTTNNITNNIVNQIDNSTKNLFNINILRDNANVIPLDSTTYSKTLREIYADETVQKLLYNEGKHDQSKVPEIINQLVSLACRNSKHPNMMNIYCPTPDSDKMFTYREDTWAEEECNKAVNTLMGKIRDGAFMSGTTASEDDTLKLKKYLFDIHTNTQSRNWKNGLTPMAPAERQECRKNIKRILLPPTTVDTV
jgi:hypothetical protein